MTEDWVWSPGSQGHPGWEVEKNLETAPQVGMETEVGTEVETQVERSTHSPFHLVWLCSPGARVFQRLML